MIVESLSQSDNTAHEASSGEASIQLVRDYPIDIVFMDYSLPGLDGVATSMRLLQLNEKLKIYNIDRTRSSACVKAGFAGWNKRVHGQGLSN